MNQKLTIAIVTSEFVTESSFDGGLANYTYRLAKSLQLFGHRPVVFVSSQEDEKIMHDGIEVYRVKIRRYDDWIYSNRLLCKPYSNLKRKYYVKIDAWQKWESRRWLRQQSHSLNEFLKNKTAEIKFDVIHFANLGGVGYFRPRNIPSVARLSGSNAEAFKYGGYGETLKQIILQEKLENNTLKKMDAIFGPSVATAERLKKQIHRDIQIIESLYIKDSVKEDESVYNEQLKNKKYLLFFGTIGLIKGCGTIARGIKSFLERYPDHNFVFVGKVLHSKLDGVNMIEYLKKEAGEFSDRVIHIGKIPHSSLYPIIRHAQIVTLPSRNDNFPNTCIEAMAHGKIVIGTRGNGFEQLIEDKVNGYLVPIDAPEQLYEAIDEALALPKDKKEQMEKKAVERIDKLSPEHIIPQIVQLYQKAISKYN